MAERITQYRWFWAWDYDKEEAWLNQMAAEGWVLVSVGFCKFVFERREPGDYTVRLEMRDHDENYISFMEETGAEYIGRVFLWQYYRRRTEFGRFDVFSDLESKLSHLRRIHNTLLTVDILNLGAGMLNLVIGMSSGINVFTAMINLLVSNVLMYGVGRMKGKMEFLENERRLRE